MNSGLSLSIEYFSVKMDKKHINISDNTKENRGEIQSCRVKRKEKIKVKKKRYV